MIEYYTFKHNGGAENYNDEVFLSVFPHITLAIFYGSVLGEKSSGAMKVFTDILSGENAQMDFQCMARDIEKAIPDNAEYIALRITDEEIDSVRRGRVLAKIINNGELKDLPNGIFGLANEDRIICATDNFFKYISDEGIMADALCSLSCEEWMDNMVDRISDENRLDCGNLSAVTLIVRSED